MSSYSDVVVLSDEQLIEAFDKIAERAGIKPPETPGQQQLVAMLISYFIGGARYQQFLQETHEANKFEFALPGLDFDPYDILKKH